MSKDDTLVKVTFSAQEALVVLDETRSSKLSLHKFLEVIVAMTLLDRRCSDWLSEQSNDIKTPPPDDFETEDGWMKLKQYPIVIEDFYHSHDLSKKGMIVTLCFPEWASDLAMLFKLTHGGS